jgi:hypothetical protein
MLSFGSDSEMFNRTMYYFAFSYVTLYPITMCVFLLIAGQKGLQNEVVNAHFGSLYSGLDLSSRIKPQQVTVFLARRAIIGIAIAFCRELYFVQLEILLVTTLFCLCFVITVRPFSTWLGNTIELVNETLVLGTIYLLHCFSFFIPGTPTRYNLGWIYVGVVGIVFIVNLFVIIRAAIMFAIMTIKREKKGHNIQKWLQEVIKWVKSL